MKSLPILLHELSRNMHEAISNKFTQHFRKTVERAFFFSHRADSATIAPVHLLWGILTENGSLANEILRKAGIKLPDSFEAGEAPGDAAPHILFEYPFSEASKKIIRASVASAAQNNHKYIGTEHLLQGLLSHDDEEVRAAFRHQHVDARQLQAQITLVLKSTSRFPDLTQAIAAESEGREEREETAPSKKSKTPALDFFATELTSPRAQSRIDQLVGRDQEINRIIQILSRKNKNNPILLGDPGVGKTAIVEGLAKRIFEGSVPDILLRKRLYSLDLPSVVAGTVYRGEFESRIKQIIDEARADDSIILFIDEIHTIIGAGSASGSLDAANILKPALARGEIRCIGATTYEEYKRHLETDPALERRFQAVLVPEPSIEETIAILQGIKSSYESHHRVTVTDEALEAAARLSARYISDKRLPDKAIDLIDEASARKRIMSGSDPTVRKVRYLEQSLAGLKTKKEQAVRAENFPLALRIKEEERVAAQEIKSVQDEALANGSSHSPLGAVEEDDVLHVLASMTGIPLGALKEEERENLLSLEDALAQRIVGQDETLHEIAGFIRRSRAGLAGSRRPLGSFMFLGPSGVGKTETAKVLAETLFHDRDALVRFDMSEFSESFQTAKLIGAPAGYVGYREGGKLTEAVRRKPYSVILLDEVEKAHPDVFNLFLSILDEGHLTDATGKRVDFRNTIIILTSNVGLAAFNQHAALGFETEDRPRTPSDAGHDYERIKEIAMSDLKDRFRPEFLNRIDRIIVFRPLQKKHIHDITALHLRHVADQLASQKIKLQWNDRVTAHIANLSMSPTEGARRVRKTVRENIEDKVAELILKKKVTPGMTAYLTVKNDAVIVSEKGSRSTVRSKS